MTHTFTAVYEEAEEGGYTAWVEELRGAISQGETLDEARENLKEAIELILECNREEENLEIAVRRVIREPIVISA